jgi:hypothetical protein
MAGNRLFGHQGQLARSRQIVVKHGSALLSDATTAQVNRRSRRIRGRPQSLALMRVGVPWLSDPSGMRQGFPRKAP